MSALNQSEETPPGGLLLSALKFRQIKSGFNPYRYFAGAIWLPAERVLLKDSTQGPLPRQHVAFPITQRQVWLDAKEGIQSLE